MKRAYKILSIIFMLIVMPHLYFEIALAGDKSVLKGKVLDIEGKAVEGAIVFIYDSPDIKRLADFMSPHTDKEGGFRVVLPSGKYWAVARLKKGESYGPLMPGDKHSGEPREIELDPGGELYMDFVVADLKDAARAKKKIREDYFKIKGKIIDENGLPVRMAYAIANRDEKISGVPDYISAWTDEEGYYTLYVPRGKYYIGSALTFPPGENYNINQEVVIESDSLNVDIISSASRGR